MGFSNRDEHNHGADYEADMFTGITTYHGLVRIYNAKTWLSRLFWLTIVITSFSVFTYQAFILLRHYESRPTLYQSNVRVPSDGLAFPAVTVCNYSPVKMDRILANVNYEPIARQPNLLKYSLMSYMSLENVLSLENTSDVSAWHDQMENFTKNEYKKFSLAQFFNDTSYNCSEFFTYCSFAGFRFNCCDVAEPLMTDVGLCWKFSSFGEQPWMNRQFVSGHSFGLRLLIDSQIDQYPKSALPSPETGVRFQIHRSDEVPQLSSKSIGVSPGHFAYAALRITHWELLRREEWGECQENWDRADIPDRLSNYTLTNCETNCLANYFNHTCGCVPLKYYISGFEVEDVQKVCYPQELLTCFQQHMAPPGGVVLHGTKSAGDVSGAYWYNCSGVECGMECHRREYSISMGYTRMEPNLTFLQEFHELDDEYVRNNYIGLNVFYSDISYKEHIQQRALDATIVISNVGGNTGMFLGMSVITLAEIFVFFVKWAWPLIMPKRRRQIRTKIEPSSSSDHLEAQDLKHGFY